MVPWQLAPLETGSALRRGAVRPGFGLRIVGQQVRVFLFFSNRLGCLGSLLLSVTLTILLIAVVRLW